MNETHKIRATHLARKAYLYVRQSTLRQVVEHEEGRRRQYQLRERAQQLGWPDGLIEVIDCDQGLSGASADREGFRLLVSEVGLGKAGLVMGLEVSRLARNSMEWHRLLEICGLSDTLILDEDGLYDPQQFNDRLLLGLKGTMSEAELHVLRARLQGGIRSKAKRGEFRTCLPIGFVYDETGDVVLDPDQQVQETLRLFFRVFGQTGTALRTVRHFQSHGIPFPRRTDRRHLCWGQLDYSTAYRILKNPRYAGTYSYGRTRSRTMPDGRRRLRHLGREDWVACLPGAHPGYISPAEFEANVWQLTDNGVRCGTDRRVAREGSALLQGLVLCGRCGRHMKVRYHCDAGGGLRGSYYCRPKEGPCCQVAHGGVVDAAISRIVLETMTPLTLELSLEIHSEVESRFDQAQKLCDQRVERARYEAERARDRFMQVDPRNRLVAGSLEAEWNRCLGRLAEARADLEDNEKKRPDLTDEQRSDILGLAADFPRLWNSRQTPAREKKRLLRLLIDDVTLLRDGEQIEIHVRFRGGASQSLRVQRPTAGSGLRRTEPKMLARIDTLLDDLIATQIAEKLNDEGLQTATGLRFTGASIAAIARNNGLQSRAERLSRRGYLPGRQAARRLGISYSKLLALAARGEVQRYAFHSRYAFYDIQPMLSASLGNSNEEGVQYEA